MKFTTDRVLLIERVRSLLLDNSSRGWTITELERSLLAEAFVLHTFDVRDAVWRLVHGREAEFTAELHVRARCG